MLKKSDAPVTMENAIKTTIIKAEKIPMVAKSFTVNLFDISIIIPPKLFSSRKHVSNNKLKCLYRSDRLYPFGRTFYGIRSEKDGIFF